MTTIASEPRPYAVEDLDHLQAQFARDGYLHIPGLLGTDEAGELRARMDRIFDDQHLADNRYKGSDWIAVRLFETDPLFEDMVTREPIIGLVEHILGPDCHLIAQNGVRNKRGVAVDSFHVDDEVFCPVAPSMARHPADACMPIHMVTIQILLSDVPSLAYGPTQYVPGSHYSGRNPNDAKAPSFEGREPVSILGKAGDIYLHNPQCWHRGAPNDSDRTRYLLQLAYGKRWISQRFYPFMNYRMPQHVIDRADARRRRVLGFHPNGPYG